MRVGKTTAVKVIGEGLTKLGYSVSLSFEDWQNNPYLSESYHDPDTAFLESQKWFAKRKHEQVLRGAESKVFIQDVAPEMDYCYAETNRRLGRMGEKHFLDYHDFYHKLEWDKVPQPNLYVYLALGDDELIQRAIESKREFETVLPEYFLMMKKVNREWLSFAKDKYQVLEVDTNNLNFADREEDKNTLVEMVKSELNLT